MMSVLAMLLERLIAYSASTIPSRNSPLIKYRTNPKRANCSAKTATWSQIVEKNYGWLD